MSLTISNLHVLRYYTYQMCRRKLHTSCLHRATSSHARTKKNTAENIQEIVIPNRIERGPTDILRAIASTVKKDYRNPHYKYIDDPETIPTSTIAKKAYSLAKASGKRAAQYVVSRHPKIFSENYADPSIEAFMPPMRAGLAEDTEEGLRERIELRMVDQAVQSYRKCREAGVELSADVVLDLLDVLCSYNSEDPKDPLLQEEQEFSRLMTPDSSREKVRNTWKDNGAAEEVFSSLENPPLRAYCSLIRGRAKFYQMDKAHELFKEMKAEGLTPDLATFNTMIKVVAFVQNRADAKISQIKELLSMMQQCGLQPTIKTFNNALSTLPRSVRFHPPMIGKFTSSLLSEMAACGIEPTLATWNHVTKIFYWTDESQSGILEEIITRLEGTDLEATHPDDLDFFSNAMAKCSINLKDMELAYRIDELLNYGQNYRVIGDNFREGLYYNFFMKTLCMFEEIDTVMEYFDKIVPHSFVPTFNSLDELFEAIELNEGHKYLPKIWSEVHSMGYDRSLNVLKKVAALMAKQKHPDELQQQIYNLIFYSYEAMLGEVDFLEEKNLLEKTELLPMTSAPLLSHMCQICLDSGQPQQAENMFTFYVEHKAKIRGNFLEKTAKYLADHFIKSDDFNNALEVLKVMSNFAHTSIDVTAERVKEEMELSEQDRY